ncbi:ABC transporter transmembrane domain-containing protein [Lapidilactobacillus bayanensis]|uniref:ABC transporter transmembrane domain-containing protein n=1 Tax=Lapidilactobacillus bayanensis TaxID=2485998 RepID=UPI000F7B1526|nr:ABC transporter transmembrane domain-containing protein [Lapidilactobacillus bayanensis]
MSLWKCLKQEPKLNLLVLFWQVLGAACVTMYGLGSANIVTSIVKFDAKAVIMWLIILEGTNIIWGIQIAASQAALERAVQTMDTNIRNAITANLIKTDYQQFHHTDVATYISWVTNDISTINDYGFETLALVISQAITILMSIGVIIQFHYSMIITIGVLLVVMLTVPKLFTSKMNAVTLHSTKVAEHFTAKFTDIFAGFDDLMQLNRKSVIQKITNKSSEDLA